MNKKIIRDLRKKGERVYNCYSKSNGLSINILIISMLDFDKIT